MLHLLLAARGHEAALSHRGGHEADVHAGVGDDVDQVLPVRADERRDHEVVGGVGEPRIDPEEDEHDLVGVRVRVRVRVHELRQEQMDMTFLG